MGILVHVLVHPLAFSIKTQFARCYCNVYDIHSCSERDNSNYIVLLQLHVHVHNIKLKNMYNQSPIIEISLQNIYLLNEEIKSCSLLLNLYIDTAI